MSFGWFQLLKTWIDDYVTISCARRAAFAQRGEMGMLGDDVSSVGGSVPGSTVSAPAAVFSTMSLDHLGPTPSPVPHHAHTGPNLAIDTASAGYQAVAPLDNNAITPRPAFTASGAATTASGPGVAGVAGTPTPSPGLATLTGTGSAPPSFM